MTVKNSANSALLTKKPLFYRGLTLLRLPLRWTYGTARCAQRRTTHVEKECVLHAVLEPARPFFVVLVEGKRFQLLVRQAARVVVRVPLPRLLDVAHKVAAIEHDH